MELISRCSYTAFMNTWNERLRETWPLKYKSLAALSRACDVSRDSLQKYVKDGVNQPRGDTMQKIADALEVDYLWLKEGIASGNAPKIRTIKRLWITDRLREVGKTKPQLAKALTLKGDTINNIINGTEDLPAGDVMKFADFMNMDPGDVLTKFSIKETEIDTDYSILDGDELDTIEYIRGLSDAGKQEFMHRIRNDNFNPMHDDDLSNLMAAGLELVAKGESDLETITHILPKAYYILGKNAETPRMEDALNALKSLLSVEQDN